MALYEDPFIDGEGGGGGPIPPPNVPPPIGTGGGTTPLGGGGGTTPLGGGGGGGGGGAPFTLPALPNFNLLGNAPAFNAPQFHAPVAAELYSDPGYQARLDASTKALERSAAAKGMLRTGGTLNDISELSQNFASQEYQGAFQRALAAHDAAFRGAQASYMPGFEAWKLRNQGLQQALLAGYQGGVQNAVNQAAPHGGGGGGPDPLMELLPFLLGGDAPPQYGGGGGYGGGGHYGAGGDPWTDY